MRTGPDHRTIPAKIFVENLNCPDLTASFLAGAKDLWRIQKTACLLLPPLLYLGSSGQFPEWLTFDVNDPKVLRGVLEGDSLQGSKGVLRAALRPCLPRGSLFLVMEQDKAKLLLKADAYIAFLVEQGKVFTYLPQGQTGIFGTVYQPRPAELYPGLQGAMDYCLLSRPDVFSGLRPLG